MSTPATTSSQLSALCAESPDTDKPWSQQVCERIAELERRVQDGGTLAATIVINLRRGSIRSDDDAALLALANRLLDERPAKGTIISKQVMRANPETLS